MTTLTQQLQELDALENEIEQARSSVAFAFALNALQVKRNALVNRMLPALIDAAMACHALKARVEALEKVAAHRGWEECRCAVHIEFSGPVPTEARFTHHDYTDSDVRRHIEVGKRAALDAGEEKP